MVTEDPKTLDIIRAEYIRLISARIYSDSSEHSTHNAQTIYDTGLLEQCTTLQLRALWNNFLSLNTPIKLHHCNPADHLSLTAFGMYIGIEPDGYTHS